MNLTERLSSSLGRKDEGPNVELAEEIVKRTDKKAVGELISNLSKTKAIQNDSIKVLYEIGKRAPKLIVEHIGDFASQLDSKNNRLQWGSMTALATIASEYPKEIYAVLPVILLSAEKGSVLYKDQLVNILITLGSYGEYSESIFPLVIEQLMKCPTNQLPMYAENSVSIVNNSNRALFAETLTVRLAEIEKLSKRRRVEKILRKLA